MNLDKDNTFTIIDWDDTICPTYYLAGVGYSRKNLNEPVNEYLCGQLKEFEAEVIRLLTKALTCSQVYIVTAANKSWLNKMTEKFLPGLLPILKQVKIYSARDLFEDGTGDICKWKYKTFKRIFSEKLKHQQALVDSLATTSDDSSNSQSTSKSTEPFKPLQFISIGDSNAEREALKRFGRDYEEVLIKTIKLSEDQSRYRLLCLLKQVCFLLEDVYADPEDVHLDVTDTLLKYTMMTTQYNLLKQSTRKVVLPKRNNRQTQECAEPEPCCTIC